MTAAKLRRIAQAAPGFGDLQPLPKPTKYHEWGPTWSPDGAQIAFVSSFDGDNDVYIQRVSADKAALGGAKQITKNNTRDTGPTFSPDGKTIAYSNGSNDCSHVWATAASGLGSPTRLTPDTGPCPYGHLGPVYSPDGKKLVYSSFDYALFVLDVESKIETPLVTQPGASVSPDWQALGFEFPAAPENGEGEAPETPDSGETGTDGENGNEPTGTAARSPERQAMTPSSGRRVATSSVLSQATTSSADSVATT